MATAVTTPAFAYVRVHRRRGKQRCLAPAELSAWAERLRSLPRLGLCGPVHFLWGDPHAAHLAHAAHHAHAAHLAHARHARHARPQVRHTRTSRC